MLLIAALIALAGRLHPVGDSVAAFALHLGAGAVLLYALCWLAGAVTAERLTGLAAVLLLAPVLWSAMTGAGDPGARGVTLYQHNVLWSNPTPDAVVDQLRGSDADIVVLQEVMRPAARLRQDLAALYPHITECGRPGLDRNAVLSRFAILAQECGMDWTRATLDTPLGPVHVVSVHLKWPWPHGQRDSVARVVAGLPQDGLPVILAGDMNAAPWSAAVGMLAEASGTRRARGVRLTFSDPRFRPGLPIDHVLVPEGWGARATMLGAAGADHRATLARIGPGD